MSILDENLIEQGTITPTMRAALTTMAPWLRYVGVCGTVMSALGILGVLVFIFQITQGPFAAIGGTFVIVGPLIMLAMSALSLYLCILLTQAGGLIKQYLQHNDLGALETSFAKQKTFWVMTGIVVTVFVLFVIIGVVSDLTLLL